MTQAVHADEPVISALNAPATHAVHTADVLAGATEPYAPAAQAVHTLEVEAATTLL